MLRNIAVAGLVCGLLACSGNAGPSDADVKKLIQDRMIGKQRGKYLCSDYFDVHDVKIIDRKAEGKTATVVVETTFRSKARVPSGHLVSGCVDGKLWAKGAIGSYRETLEFEKWQSGWREM